MWRIECDYEWVDSRASSMISVSKFAAERNVRRTLSGHLISPPHEDSGGSEKMMSYSVDVDFPVVHQV